MRNSDRLGVAHLYFHGGKLVHIVGSSGDAEATLRDMQFWTHASVRFERGATVTGASIKVEQEQTFDELLLHFQQLGLAETPVMPRVVEGGVINRMPGDRLLTPREWHILSEGTRRVSLAVTQLVGRRKALKVLRDILDGCSATLPAFATLSIASSGYIQVSATSQLNSMLRRELLEGFNALLAACQHFCVSQIGEADAHNLVSQALGILRTELIDLGVFHLSGG